MSPRLKMPRSPILDLRDCGVVLNDDTGESHSIFRRSGWLNCQSCRFAGESVHLSYCWGREPQVIRRPQKQSCSEGLCFPIPDVDPWQFSLSTSQAGGTPPAFLAQSCWSDAGGALLSWLLSLLLFDHCWQWENSSFCRDLWGTEASLSSPLSPLLVIRRPQEQSYIFEFPCVHPQACLCGPLLILDTALCVKMVVSHWYNTLIK